MKCKGIKGETMRKKHQDSRGFTLIAALLLTVLLSGMAVGLLYMVSNEVRMGGNDLEGNMAYYAAEAQIENLTSQLSQLYQSSQSPNSAAINALWTNTANWANAVPGSNIANVSYNSPSGVSQIVWPAAQANGTACPNGNPCGSWDIVGAGSDQGMVATLIPFTLTVTATRQAGAGQLSTDAAAASGSAVTLTRTVEVALLPAFEFGIFCDGDCDYFAGPNFNFGGRVHTNGSIFLASGAKLTFTDKVAAVGQVIMDQLENGHATSSGYTGTVYVPNAAAGCPSAPGTGPATNCPLLPAGSWTGGFYPIAGSPNPAWTGISKSTFNGFIENGLTGATKLQLPFVNSSKVGAIDIIRKPTPGDSTLLASSRLYNQASIRILLADTQGDLYPGETRTDSSTQDIQIGYPFTNLTSGTSGYVTVAASSVTAGGNLYLATAQQKSSTNNWTTVPTGCTTATLSTLGNTPPAWPLFGQVTVSGKQCQGAWLRVEYQNAAGQWLGITTQWLSYGFARNYDQPPTHPYNTSTATAPVCSNLPTYPAAQCQNSISPAILILQQLQAAKTAANAYGATGANYFIPLNFYDSREGEPRDTRPSADPGTMCSPAGIMNSVELDVGNLWLWLQGSGPYSGGSGKLVTAANYNGYILYFADHRGMLTDAYPLTVFNNGFSGMSGLNDVVNSSSSLGVPDGALEPMTYYATASPTPYSPEDVAVKGAAVNLGQVDNWGQTNLGAGFGITPSPTNTKLPYYIYGSVTANAVQCFAGTVTTNSSGVITAFAPTYNVPTAEWNMVTGPRHVLRLVDAGMDTAGNSFVPPTNGTVANNGKGFTVASEEPVYVYGDYNTGSADPFWPSENTTTTPHSAAAIIADSVTLLSNPPANNTSPTAKVGWTDIRSFQLPDCATTSSVCALSRPGNTSYYRMAIAAGKSIPFPQPAWGGQDMGTDGGMHNFLRYLEDRGANSATVNYAGSMISMFYSQYNTGVFKCCSAVYGAPTRNYFFDTQFLDPNNLPPGTPSFQDVVSLSYHQSFSTQ